MKSLEGIFSTICIDTHIYLLKIYGDWAQNVLSIFPKENITTTHVDDERMATYCEVLKISAPLLLYATTLRETPLELA